MFPFHNLTRYPGGHAFVQNPACDVTKAGLGRLFATHVLGHYFLVEQLQDLLVASTGRVIWTGSRAASSAPCVFDMQDLQHISGRGEAYGSSKYATDLLSVRHVVGDNVTNQIRDIISPALAA